MLIWDELGQRTVVRLIIQSVYKHGQTDASSAQANYLLWFVCQDDLAWVFQRVGRVTLCQSDGTQQIVM